MKNIYFFVTFLNSGGIENYLLRFLKQYQGKFDATVYCKSGTRGELASQYENIGVKVVTFKLGMFSLKDYINLYKELKNKSFDSVVDFTGNFAGMVMLVSKLVGIRTRLTFYRGSTNHFEETKIKLLYNYLMNRLVLNYSSKILSNSKSALDFFFSVRNRDDSFYKVIYNGIDAKSFLVEDVFSKSDFGIPKDSFVIGHTGRSKKS